MEKYFLACDLDGTLIPADGKLCKRSLEVLTRVIEDSRCVGFCYITGRSGVSAAEGIEEFKLPYSKYLFCDVATTLLRRDVKDRWFQCEEYAKIASNELSPGKQEEIKKYFLSHQDIKLQRQTSQGRHKISFFSFRHLDQQEIDRLGEFVSNYGRQVFYTRDTMSSVSLIDVVPKHTSKKSALEYISLKYDLRIEDHLIYAGDSGNDIDAFLSGARSIIVENCDPRVKSYVISNVSDHGKIYMAKNQVIAGVVEGLSHFLDIH